MKDNVIFDTYRVVKRCVSVGFTEAQAAVIAEEQKMIIENNLATKKDIAGIHLQTEGLKKDISELNLKTEGLKKDIEVLRQETKKDVSELNLKTEGLKKDIEVLKQETKKDIELSTKKMYIALFGSIGFFVTLLKLLQLLKL